MRGGGWGLGRFLASWGRQTLELGVEAGNPAGVSLREDDGEGRTTTTATTARAAATTAGSPAIAWGLEGRMKR